MKTYWAITGLALAVSIVTSQAAALPNNPHPACKRRTLEPYVPNQEVAKAIFLAVEAAIDPQADKKRFPLVDVMGKGDRWSVFRHNTVIGGGLEIEINKCTGRIYKAGFGE